jgi:hypothetical protein
LVCGCTPKLSRRIVLIGGGGDGVNGYTRTVRCGSGSNIPGILKETFDQIGSKTGLIEMNRNGGGCDTPCEVNTQEPFNHSHEIDFASFTQKTTEESLNSRVFREVNKVIDIETKGKR